MTRTAADTSTDSYLSYSDITSTMSDERDRSRSPTAKKEEDEDSEDLCCPFCGVPMYFEGPPDPDWVEVFPGTLLWPASWHHYLCRENHNARTRRPHDVRRPFAQAPKEDKPEEPPKEPPKDNDRSDPDRLLTDAELEAMLD